ncbi:hypothetical protein MPLDJ20_100068 [Mesorhizobium plurifarium]|uniref:Uncharacterized protein n=1 Tax=Mesorhizobium plurifarium TaxID=69974 RepID=A0A090DF78_MESPL|nr:hypothetical protein MPLDJ20_100068 [Mesorhizobium plurifarium]
MPVVDTQHRHGEAAPDAELRRFAGDAPRSFRPRPSGGYIGPKERLQRLGRIDADAVHGGMLGFHIALEPAFRPAVQFYHRREFLPAQGHATQYKMLESKLCYCPEQIAQKRPCSRVLPAPLDKVEYIRIDHARAPSPARTIYSLF